MNTRRGSLIHSYSMFQTPAEHSSGSTLHQSNSAVKPPIFTSSHSISQRRSSSLDISTRPSRDAPSACMGMKGSRRSSMCVPSQSLQKICEKNERSSSMEGIPRNRRLSISTHGNLEMLEKKVVPERKLSVANLSEHFSSFLSLSSKGVRVRN